MMASVFASSYGKIGDEVQPDMFEIFHIWFEYLYRIDQNNNSYLKYFFKKNNLFIFNLYLCPMIDDFACLELQN